MVTSSGTLRAKVPSAVIPLLFVASVGAAYVSGMYVAMADAKKREVEASKMMEALHSADELRLHASLLERLRSGDIAATIRVLEFKSQAEAAAARDCLSNPFCTSLVAPTQAAEVEFKELLAKHAAR